MTDEPARLDDVDALVIWHPEARVWLVPSRSEVGFRTVDTIVIAGIETLVCDCPAGYMGHRRGSCHHIELVNRWIANHPDEMKP